MKVVLKNTEGINRKITAFGSRKAQAAAAERVANLIRVHMLRTKLRVEYSRHTGALGNPGNWSVTPILTPVPGATLSTNVPYAKILNYDKRPTRQGKNRFLERSITETSGKHAAQAAEGYRRAVRAK